MKKIALFIFVCFLSMHVSAQTTQKIDIHSGTNVQTIFVNDIDSISFGEMSTIDMIRAKEKMEKEKYNELQDLLDGKNGKSFVYNDFSLNEDKDNIYKMTTQSGHQLMLNGEGYQSTAIRNGIVYNDINYRMYVNMDAPIKYIGMTYSYHNFGKGYGEYIDHIPPCVILLGQKNDTWTHIIHLLFYDDHLTINTRQGDDFLNDCVNVGGNGRFAAKGDGEKYSVSVQIIDDKLYVKKPNGEYLIMQNEYFKEAFPVACWQVANKPEYNNLGCINEIFAGVVPNSEIAWRYKSLIK